MLVSHVPGNLNDQVAVWPSSKGAFKIELTREIGVRETTVQGQ